VTGKLGVIELPDSLAVFASVRQEHMRLLGETYIERLEEHRCSVGARN
jgi:hypothetical protein